MSGVNAEIVVSANAPEVVATPIPVQDPTQIIVIETLMPTVVVTEAGAITQVTEVPAVSASAEPTAVLTVGGDVDSGSEQGLEKQEKGSLWWLLTLPLVIVAGFIIIRRKQVNQPDPIDHSGGNNEE